VSSDGPKVLTEDNDGQGKGKAIPITGSEVP
jgi:hypothetical protein